MKTVAAVFADFDHTFWGGRSQLETELGGRSILAHTLARLDRVEGPSARCVVVRPEHAQKARAAIASLALSDRIEVLSTDDGRRRRRELIRSARKWNFESWRGSPLGTTYFDEFCDAYAIARVVDQHQAQAVLCLDGHMPLLDVNIASAMLRHAEDHPETGFTFTQAPPGIAGLLLRRETVRDVLQRDIPVGLLMSYRPETPRIDLITRPECLPIDATIFQTAARLTGDMRHSLALLRTLVEKLGATCAAPAVFEQIRRDAPSRAARLPLEVTLELTTDDPLPETTLRPRGASVPGRSMTSLARVEALARELAEDDDRLVVLGGHGDPLLHPGFAHVCAVLRGAGVFGIGVETTLVELSDESLAGLLDARVDVVEVRLDAITRETYARVHGADHFERVLANLARIEAERVRRQSPQPIVLCSLTRCAATLPEMEAFFDHWIRASGGAVLRGYSRFCGALPPDVLLTLTPPVREPCRRISRRLTLLADGRVPLCDEDARGETSIGDWQAQSLAEIWSGRPMQQARTAHAGLSLQQYAPCTRCDEWFRP